MCLFHVGEINLALHQTGVLLVLSRTGALSGLSHAARAGLGGLDVLDSGLGTVAVLSRHLSARAGGFDSANAGVGFLATGRGGHCVCVGCVCLWWLRL